MFVRCFRLFWKLYVFLNIMMIFKSPAATQKYLCMSTKNFLYQQGRAYFTKQVHSFSPFVLRAFIQQPIGEKIYRVSQGKVFDQVENDLKSFKIKNWMMVAEIGQSGEKFLCRPRRVVEPNMMMISVASKFDA